MEQILKKCKCCGRELPINNFKSSRWGGRVNICTECATNKLRENKKKKLDEQKQKVEDVRAENRQLCLADFTPRELMTELARRGYRGKLQFIQVQEIDIENF